MYLNVLGNEVASLLAWLALGVPVWFAKIGPHLTAQREHRHAEQLHRETVVAQLAALRDQPRG